MFFRRKAYVKLLQWKELAAGTSAVLLEGDRRIGKSTIVEEFAKNEYDDYMILDFARDNRDVQNLFIDDMDDLDILFLIVSTDVVGFKQATFFLYHVDALCMIHYIQPVTYVLTIAIYRKFLAFKYVDDD